MSMSVSTVPASSVPNLTYSSASQSSTALSSNAAKTAAQQFEQWANMTPAQRLHAEMLAQLGLTEDQFKALSPAQQQKINDQIAQMIKKQIGDTTTNAPA